MVTNRLKAKLSSNWSPHWLLFANSKQMFFRLQWFGGGYSVTGNQKSMNDQELVTTD